MATLKYLSQYFSTTLNVGGGIDASQTTGIVIQSVAGITDITKPGQICVSYSDPIDTGVAEWIDYTSINGSNELVGAVRGREGFSAHPHVNGAAVAFVLSASHHNDVVDAVKGAIDGTIAYAADAGSTDAYAITLSPAPTAYAAGQVFRFKANTVNTGAATLNVNSLGAKTIVKNYNATLADGDILANQLVEVIYDGTNFQLLSPIANTATSGSSFGMGQQAIINGNFDVWQRGTSLALVDATVQYQADRWGDYVSKDSGTLPTLTRSRQLLTSGDIPNAFYLTRLATNGAGTSLGVNSAGMYFQRIENGVRNLCGLNKTVTLSFWASSSIANKRICPTFRQCYGTGGSPSATEYIKGTPITLTSTLTKYTATFTTNTLVGKTFGTAGDDYVEINIAYMWGTTYGNTYVQTSVTAETFVGSGNIDIAQVQLSAGSTALTFQPKSYAQELQDCLRFCFVPETSQTVATLATGFAYSTTIAFVPLKYPTKMRIIPTLTVTGTDWQLGDGGAAYDITALDNTSDSVRQTADSALLRCTVASGLTANRPYMLQSDSNANRVMIFSSEL